MNELLRSIFDPVNALLGALPMGAARVATTVLLVAPLLAVLWLPRASILRGAPSASRWRDLRVWAVVAMLPYVVLYLLAP
ncbi:MAG TPA: hypothetical protein VMT85_18575 [Thermoanaerobaculia bacterium]|nr:hypothetical protein [Thermoanaerobaculia bacterium]